MNEKQTQALADKAKMAEVALKAMECARGLQWTSPLVVVREDGSIDGFSWPDMRSNELYDENPEAVFVCGYRKLMAMVEE